MSVEVVTKEDLEVFRVRLVSDIKELLSDKQHEPKEWLKSIEVRKILKVSHGTLQSLRVTGKLNYSKIGGTYYYKSQDIVDLLDMGANKRR